MKEQIGAVVSDVMEVSLVPASSGQLVESRIQEADAPLAASGATLVDEGDKTRPKWSRAARAAYDRPGPVEKNRVPSGRIRIQGDVGHHPLGARTLVGDVAESHLVGR